MNGSASVTARLFGITFASLGVSFDARIDSNSGGSVDVSLSVTGKYSHPLRHDSPATPASTSARAAPAAVFPGRRRRTIGHDLGRRRQQRHAVPEYRDAGARPKPWAHRARPIPSLGSNGTNTESYIIIDDAAATRPPARRSRSRPSATRRPLPASSASSTTPPTQTAWTTSRSSSTRAFRFRSSSIGGPNNNNFVDNGSGYADRLRRRRERIRREMKTSSRPGQSVPHAVLVGGPAYNNLVNLSSSPAFIVGGPGNNQITGGSGADVIYGHATLTSPVNQNFTGRPLDARLRQLARE